MFVCLFMARTHTLLLGMSHFKDLVDKTIALVKEKQSVSLAALAYDFGVSYDYARKVAKVAAGVSPEPMEIAKLWNRERMDDDPPVICLRTYREAWQAKLETKR